METAVVYTSLLLALGSLGYQVIFLITNESSVVQISFAFLAVGLHCVSDVGL